MKTFVLGYGDTEPAKHALERTGELARALDANVVVVSVAHALVPAGRGIGPIDPTDPPELHREELLHAKAELDEAGIAADAASPTVVRRAWRRGADGRGDPGHATCRRAKARLWRRP